MTGRIGNNAGPELQNIPVPRGGAFKAQVDRLVAEHKASLKAAEGYVTANYAEIELRLLASQEGRTD